MIAVAPPQPTEHAPAQPLVCATPAPVSELNRQAARVQALLEETDKLKDPAARTLVNECLHSLLGFYGDGLKRILEMLRTTVPNGEDFVRCLGADPGVRGLLLIHGLHPVDLETRLRAALETVRPYMQSHGGNVELVSLEDGFARLRLQGTCHGCPSSSVTLDLSVRRAIEEACPDLAGFEVQNS